MRRAAHTKMATRTNYANRISNPRLLQALRDPEIDLIVEAARRMPAAGHRRANLIAENGDRVRWVRAYLELLDEARLAGVPDIEIAKFVETVAEAGRQRVYVGTAAPKESVGEVLAEEAVAECAANQDAARLVDEPHNPSILRALFHSLTSHQVKIDKARRVVAYRMRVAR